jgi:alpha-L-rhamnosidase
MTKIANLACEYRINPMGIDVVAPRFSWQMKTNRHGARQTAYRVLAASSNELLHDENIDLWDSGRVESDHSVHVVYEGKRLLSRQRVYWNVAVWDEVGSVNQSETAWFEMGLLKRSEWRGKWIGAALTGGPRSTIPAPYLRKSYTLPCEVLSARLYITVLGLYECSINGQLVSDEVLAPGWTDYRKRVQYRVYDVSNLLHEGENVIGIILGDGWAVGHIGLLHRQQYFDRPRLLAQLEITLVDGSMVTVATDRTWRHWFGPLLENDLIMGEAYDARLEMPGWDQPSYDDGDWFLVEVFEDPCIEIAATNGPTMRRFDELRPISDPIDKSSPNEPRYIFDLGQNIVGRIRLKGKALMGTTVTLRFAEVLNPDGTLYTTNLRTARATDYYTFKGVGEESWEPKFTFHGFRYVETLGYTGEVNRATITGVVLYSDLSTTGEFECSDETVNGLQHNIVWSQRGNFVDVPTDCPQRDERLGWTGDIQVFVRTAAFNMDVASFMTRWAKDLADAQSEEGSVPAVIPKVVNLPEDGGPAWADAAVICPWTVYLCYGDKRILEENYDVMRRFMQFITDSSPGYIRCAPEFEGWPGFGDWLSINAATPRDLIGTAFLAYDASLMARIATVLGNASDAKRYHKLFADVKKAFGSRYLIGRGVRGASSPVSKVRQKMDDLDRISRGDLPVLDYKLIPSRVFNTDLFAPTQTAYVLALYFDLLPIKLRQDAVDELVADIERRGMHLSTGFVGSPYLLHVLSEYGRLIVAYTLLLQDTWPSWLYPVKQGATTIWERWDGWTSENGFQNPEMNSFNHYAYGSIGAWLYSTVAGIEIDLSQPGYKHIILHPQPGGGLTYAKGTLTTNYGEVVSYWRIDGVRFEYEVVVPPNTTATVYLPIKEGCKMLMNGKTVNGSIHRVRAGKNIFVVC